MTRGTHSSTSRAVRGREAVFRVVVPLSCLLDVGVKFLGGLLLFFRFFVSRFNEPHVTNKINTNKLELQQ